jgi:L-asparaginase
MTDKPRIAVLALGGTIAMVKGDHGGVRPGLGADDLVAAVPGIDRFATISAETVNTVGSSDLTVDDVLAVASRITELVDAGAIDGAVVTQGTDTMEESSFLLDLALDGRIPVVVTGAMRNPLSVSHDGPGNLLAAVMTVADLEVRRRSAKLGVLVVLLDTIHAAIDVAKASPHRIDAFHSMVAGPVGVLVEDRVRLLGTPNRAHKKAFDTATGNRRPAGWTDTNASVALLTLGLGESGGLLAALADDPAHFGYSGAVLGAMGGGHTPSWVVEHVEALARRMPVVMAARIQSGYLLEATYERAGSEIDLIKRGVVSAGRLPPLKARLLLTMLLRAEATREASQAVWDTLN